MAGFILENTLSDNGGVTRGICEVDAKNHLQRVKETYEIQCTDNGLSACDESNCIVEVKPEQYVSMNMWGLPPRFLDMLEGGFTEFFEWFGRKRGNKKRILTS